MFVLHRTENTSTTISKMTEKELTERKVGAFWGLFIGDSMAMPVHWYYNPDDIKRGYGGWLSGYTAPNKRHPSSILTISATGMYIVVW